jgi:DNA-binding beta-propeller fold protein YncE
MDTMFKVNALSIDHTESILLLGNNGGQLQCVDTDRMLLLGESQASVASIYAIAAHPQQPLAATMGIDCRVCLWDIQRPRHPQLITSINLRTLTPWNDMQIIPRNHSHSQALCFHPTQPRIATRSGNAGVVELDYSKNALQVIHCTRLHHDEDVTTVRYVLSGMQLASGGLGSIVLSENGLQLANWRLGPNNVHWFEPLGQDIYLVASDDRRVYRFDFAHGQILEKSPLLTRDDLEHVTYNPTTGRAYVVGFDRRVYEIDPVTCSLVDVIYCAPFKMRWIKTLKRRPEIAFLQCFDGGVYQVNLNTRRCVSAVRRTPPVIWSACELGQGRLALTGEGDEIVQVEYATTPQTRHPQIQCVRTTRKGDKASFTKRMITDHQGSLWLGQSSGALIQADSNSHRQVAKWDSAIRDIAVNAKGNRLLVCLENGEFHSVDRESGTVRASWCSETNQPLWALAPHGSEEIVAVAERTGRIHFLHTETAAVIRVGPKCRRVKRLKWQHADTLLYNFADKMHRYHWQQDFDEPYVSACDNTVEDFIWNEQYGYLVLINYATNIILCDLASGQKIHQAPDQGDFSKGLIWLKPLDSQAYPLDFVTFGRSGTAHLFSIHDDKVVSFGPWQDALLKEHYTVDGRLLSELHPPEQDLVHDMAHQ